MNLLDSIQNNIFVILTAVVISAIGSTIGVLNFVDNRIASQIKSNLKEGSDIWNEIRKSDSDIKFIAGTFGSDIGTDKTRGKWKPLFNEPILDGKSRDSDRRQLEIKIDIPNADFTKPPTIILSLKAISTQSYGLNEDGKNVELTNLEAWVNKEETTRNSFTVTVKVWSETRLNYFAYDYLAFGE